MRLKTATLLSILAIVGLLFAQNLHAQNSARITGRVTDASSHDNLPGANVILVGTNMGTATDRFGEFTISKVPLGNYTLKVSYIGYQDYTTEVKVEKAGYTVNVDVPLSLSAIQINEVVVNGLLKGQVKALNQQMNAEQIKNVLSKEEMAKFPDMNTAEVLQRIPGVNISRSLGEGSFVYVRGTEPRLTNVTVNGQTMPSSQDQGRYVDLGVVNASQLSSIEVTKALTPEMSADAIGGTVNLVTRSPFDYERPTLKVDVGGGYANLENRPLYRASASYTGFMGSERKFGYTVSGSYYRNNIIAHSDEFDWDNVEDVNGNQLHQVLTDSRFFRYNTRRDHYGISGDFHYKINDNNGLYIRGMFNRLNDDQSRNMVRYRVSKGDYLNATTVEKARMAFEFQDRAEIHTLSSVSAGGDNTLGDLNMKYDVSYGYGLQQRNDPTQIKSEWQLDQKVNLLMDLSDVNFPKLNVTNLDPSYYYDPAHWEVDNQDARQVEIANTTWSANFDIKYPYSAFGLPSELKAGAKLSMDKKDRTGTRTKYKWKGDNTVYMDVASTGQQISDFLLGNYTFAPMVDNDKVRAWINANKDIKDKLRAYVNYLDTDGEGGNYTTNEDIYAAYLMSTFKTGNLTILAGLRDEYTNTNYKGIKILLDNNGDFLSSTNVDQTSNYNNIFPYLHFKYKIGPKTNIRLAGTQSIARPDYFDLAPYSWVDPDNEELSMGNPDLLPTISTNVDLMLAHYFQGIGVISGGFFYKNMDKVIYTRTYKQSGGQYDGYDITEPVNGGSAKLYGVELNWMQQFSFLPGFLSGFGIYGNYTYTKSEANLQYRNWSALPGQAGDVGNVGLSFEKYNLTARLSVNYTAPVLYEVGKNTDFDRYTDKHIQLDFSGVYEISSALSVYLNLINITNEVDREYFGISSRPRVNEYHGFSSRAGIKVTL